MSKQKQKKNKKSKRKGRVASDTATLDIPRASRFRFTNRFGEQSPNWTKVPLKGTHSYSIITNFCRSSSKGPSALCNKSNVVTPSSVPISTTSSTLKLTEGSQEAEQSEYVEATDSSLHSRKFDTLFPSFPSLEDRCNRLTANLKEYVDAKLNEFENRLKERS